MIRPALSLVALGLVSGCSSLGVQVDVLRPTYAATAAAATEERAAVRNLFDGNARPRAVYVASVVDRAIAIRKLCYKAAETRLKAIVPAAADREAHAVALTRLATYSSTQGVAASRAINFQDFTPYFARIDQSSQAALRASSEARAFITREDAQITPLIRSALDRHAADYEQQARVFLTDQQRCQFIAGGRDGPAVLTATSQLASALLQGIAPAIASDVSDATASLASPPPTILGNGIALTDLSEAYYVASAPKEAWQTRFNVARGKGTFGSNDIVIKLNSAADFTVKGFTFDARGTADMVSKAGVAAVKLVAEAYGMPIRAGGAGESGVTTPSPAMTADVELAVAEAREVAFKATLTSVSNLIVGDWDRLTAGDAAAQTALSASFDAGKNAWKASSTTPDQ